MDKRIDQILSGGGDRNYHERSFVPPRKRLKAVKNIEYDTDKDVVRFYVEWYTGPNGYGFVPNHIVITKQMYSSIAAIKRGMFDVLLQNEECREFSEAVDIHNIDASITIIHSVSRAVIVCPMEVAAERTVFLVLTRPAVYDMTPL